MLVSYRSRPILHKHDCVQEKDAAKRKQLMPQKAWTATPLLSTTATHQHRKTTTAETRSANTTPVCWHWTGTASCYHHRLTPAATCATTSCGGNYCAIRSLDRIQHRKQAAHRKLSLKHEYKPCAMNGFGSQRCCRQRPVLVSPTKGFRRKGKPAKAYCGCRGKGLGLGSDQTSGIAIEF